MIHSQVIVGKASKAENEKCQALVTALKDSGKSVDELLVELKGWYTGRAVVDRLFTIDNPLTGVYNTLA